MSLMVTICLFGCELSPVCSPQGSLPSGVLALRWCFSAILVGRRGCARRKGGDLCREISNYMPHAPRLDSVRLSIANCLSPAHPGNTASEGSQSDPSTQLALDTEMWSRSYFLTYEYVYCFGWVFFFFKL